MYTLELGTTGKEPTGARNYRITCFYCVWSRRKVGGTDAAPCNKLCLDNYLS